MANLSNTIINGDLSVTGVISDKTTNGIDVNNFNIKNGNVEILNSDTINVNVINSNTISSSNDVEGRILVSTAPSDVAPIVVNSSVECIGLNAEYVGGKKGTDFVSLNSNGRIDIKQLPIATEVTYGVSKIATSEDIYLNSNIIDKYITPKELVNQINRNIYIVPDYVAKGDKFIIRPDGNYSSEDSNTNYGFFVLTLYSPYINDNDIDDPVTINIEIADIAKTNLYRSFRLLINSNPNKVINWANNIKWNKGMLSAELTNIYNPIIDTSGENLIEFFTYNNGETWYATVIGTNYEKM